MVMGKDQPQRPAVIAQQHNKSQKSEDSAKWQLKRYHLVFKKNIQKWRFLKSLFHLLFVIFALFSPIFRALWIVQPPTKRDLILQLQNGITIEKEKSQARLGHKQRPNAGNIAMSKA